MSLRNSVRFWIVVGSFTLVAACGSLPSKTFHTEIVIDADVETVWQIVRRVDLYSGWNPYHVKVDGRPCLGSALTVSIHKPNGRQLTLAPYVTRLAPQREFAWGGGVRGLFHGEHVFSLERIGPRKTWLRQHERFSGIFVPFAELGSIEEGYVSVNLAIKTRAENIQTSEQPKLDPIDAFACDAGDTPR